MDREVISVEPKAIILAMNYTPLSTFTFYFLLDR